MAAVTTIRASTVPVTTSGGTFGHEPWAPPRLGARARSGLVSHVSQVPGSGSIGRPPACVARTPRPVRLAASTYRRRRAVAAGLVVGLVLVLRAAVGVLGGGPLPAPERPHALAGVAPGAVSAGVRPGVTYVVQPGDTFWSIATRLRPGADPRPLVDRMVAAHDGAALNVGERLPLPAG